MVYHKLLVKFKSHYMDNGQRHVCSHNALYCSKTRFMAHRYGSISLVETSWIEHNALYRSKTRLRSRQMRFNIPSRNIMDRKFQLHKNMACSCTLVSYAHPSLGLISFSLICYDFSHIFPRRVSRLQKFVDLYLVGLSIGFCITMITSICKENQRRRCLQQDNSLLNINQP